MKKIFSISLVFLLCLAGCENPEPAPEAVTQPVAISQSVDSYFIDGTLEDSSFTATQKVNYVNKEQQALDELYFHLYPNIYQSEDNFEPQRVKDVYPSGFQPAGIEVTEVSVLDKPLVTEVKDKLMKITLPSSLAPMDSLIITFKYKTTLPNNTDRMGYFNDCYNLTSFYPVAAVFDDGKWQVDKYGVVGDPFFTDMSNYYFNLTLPANFTVATTGSYSKESHGTMQRLSITADNVRDMAVVASPHMQVVEAVVDGTTIRSYYVDGIDPAKAQQALEYGKASLSYFNATFGKYPYDSLNIMGCEFVGGGMEYPNLVLITKDVYAREDQRYFEWLIAHEIAHQWWYGVVGNDPVKDSFIDESLTEYSTWSYIKHKYDGEVETDFKNHMILSPFEKYRFVADGKAVHKSTADFENALELSLLVYNKGCMMYMDMENFMGEDKLKEILSTYYAKHAYTIVTPQMWKQHFKDSYEYDWDAYFKKWLK